MANRMSLKLNYEIDSSTLVNHNTSCKSLKKMAEVASSWPGIQENTLKKETVQWRFNRFGEN